MGHDKWDALKDFWFTPEQFYTPFYNNMMKYDRFLHVSRALHFCDSRNQPDKTDMNYDRLWYIRSVFDMLSDTCGKFYNPYNI
jgi:hypothetical protein